MFLNNGGKNLLKLQLKVPHLNSCSKPSLNSYKPFVAVVCSSQNRFKFFTSLGFIFPSSIKCSKALFRPILKA